MKPNFHEQGYIIPERVFNRAECQKILASLQQPQAQAPMDWSKGWAATSPVFYALGTNKRILELVTALLGKDVLLWGAHLLTRRPNQVHPWHTDIESSSPTGETVSVWLGLANTSAQSAMMIVPFSHRVGITVQQKARKRQKPRRRDRRGRDSLGERTRSTLWLTTNRPAGWTTTSF